MPGGDREAYEHMRPVLEAIAAKSDSGPCVTYVGPDGAGHFVKMVHNGIEYGDMQLIAEAYDLMRKALGLSPAEMSDIFFTWNRGRSNPTSSILRRKFSLPLIPGPGKPMVDIVLDKAGQKGTGKWTVQVALDLGVPVPTIAAALDARMLSSMKEERAVAGQQYGSAGAARGRYQGDKRELLDAIGQALYAAKICSYAQGMTLIRAGSDEYRWGVDLREMARIWKAGCIIRARLLSEIMQAYERRPELPNLLLDRTFQSAVSAAQPNWRRVIATAASLGIPLPAMSASLAYFDSYTSVHLPQNLTQAQRDFFGAHTYQRADDPSGLFVHTEWPSLVRKPNAFSGGKQ